MSTAIARSRNSKRKRTGSAPSNEGFWHRTDLYARRVLGDPAAGDPIVAGPLVRLAAQRHLRDRELAVTGHPTFLWFSEAKASHAIDFFETVLRIPDRTDERGQHPLFLLPPWLCFVTGCIFGWLGHDGYRRFWDVFMEVGKGNIKTLWGAGVMLYTLTMENDPAPAVYSAANTRDQARIGWTDAVKMVEASPELSAIVHRSVGNLACLMTGGHCRPVSSEHKGIDGLRPSMVLMDESHEAASPMVILKMKAGAKAHPQPLFVETTNSGYDRTSICWQHHEHARKVLEGTVVDDRFFAYVAALDDGDDPLEDETCWPKANPSLGLSIQREYLHRQVQSAKNIPAETNTVLRLNFCIWTQAHSKAIDILKWNACQPMPTAAELAAAECFGFLDLGETDDFTAWGRLWLLADGRVATKLRYYLPRIALERYPDRPYTQWERAGILTITEGESTDYDFVREDIRKDYLADGLRSVFYDSRSARETAQLLAAQGIVMVPMLQGFQLTEAIKRTLELVTTGLLCHGDDPILAWMASNLVIREGARGERRIDKERSPEKVDGMAGLVMGVEGALVRRERTPEPQYQIISLTSGGGRWR